MWIKKSDQALLNQILTETTNGRNLWENAFLRFCHHKIALLGVICLVIVILFNFIVPYIAPHDYATTNWDQVLQPPKIKGGYWFGTDELGRDLLSRIAIGGRVSLLVGILGAVTAISVGTVYGAIAGFFGGIIDSIMMRIVDILNAFPFMFFVIFLVTLFGRRIEFIFISIGLFSWVEVARIVRGQTLSLKHKEFIEAAYVSGLSKWQNYFSSHYPQSIRYSGNLCITPGSDNDFIRIFFKFLRVRGTRTFNQLGSFIARGSSKYASSSLAIDFSRVFSNNNFV